MKHSLFLSMALALTSCFQVVDDQDVNATAEAMVNFSLVCDGMSQHSLTRANELTAPTNLLIIDTRGTTVKTKTFSSLSDVHLPLAYGVHDLYFVAAVKPWASYDTDQLTVSWGNDDRSLDVVWAYHYQIEVDENTSFEEIHLPLVVAQVSVSSLDKVAAQSATLRIEAPDASTILDLTTLSAAKTANGLSMQADISSLASKSKFKISFCTFVPKATGSASIGDVEVQVLDNSVVTQEVSSRTLSDVQIKAGYQSLFSGYFFSEGLSVPLTYDTWWLGANEYGY